MERILGPYLGANMARAAVAVARRKLGIDDVQVKPEEIEPLIEQLKPGLQVFLGAEQTKRILGEIRVTLSSTESGP
jgi:hypothetical protein